MPPVSRYTIEACVSTIDDAIEASQLGADRLEVSAALEVDGVTPTPSMVREIMREVTAPIVVLIRCRSGNFTYSAREISCMISDAQQMLDLGACAVAFGCLDRNKELDQASLDRFLQYVDRQKVVFHRAIDAASNPSDIIAKLAELGLARVLTSGGHPTALAGVKQLRAWQAEFGAKIELLPAGGIAPGHALELLQQSGCHQIHGSFRMKSIDPAHPPMLDRELLKATRKSIDA